MASALGFGRGLRNQACRLFSTAQNAGSLPGRSIESIASGCVYAACRVNGRPISFEEVDAVSRVAIDTVRDGYSLLNRELELPAEPVSPVKYLPQITDRLDVSTAVERRARNVLQADETPAVRGADPAGVAGGAVLLALAVCEESVTQAAVAEAAGVCVPTVRRYRNELE